MLLTIPDILSAAQVKQALEILNSAEWVDGKVTAGHQSVRAKHNMQLP
jgi:PKHD-type hydroxylase